VDPSYISTAYKYLSLDKKFFYGNRRFVTVFKRKPLGPIQNQVHGFIFNILSVKY
jgi:hypothetical protein